MLQLYYGILFWYGLKQDPESFWKSLTGGSYFVAFILGSTICNKSLVIIGPYLV